MPGQSDGVLCFRAKCFIGLRGIAGAILGEPETIDDFTHCYLKSFLGSVNPGAGFQPGGNKLILCLLQLSVS